MEERGTTHKDRDRKVEPKLAQRLHTAGGAYVRGMHSSDCICVFPDSDIYRETDVAVRSLTRDTGRWNTIVALFGGRSFRTCGGADPRPRLRGVTAAKELISPYTALYDHIPGFPVSRASAIFFCRAILRATSSREPRGSLCALRLIIFKKNLKDIHVYYLTI